MVVSSVYDVVFVVEDTANLAAYIDTLKTNYILPTLKHFNGGPPDAIDYGHDFSCSLYVLVTYNSGDILSSLSANCTRPTTSIHEFSTWLDGTEFLGGAGQSSSLLSEGLSTALQVFDDIKARRNESISSQKHCILVCNSPPFHLPSQESLNYSGYYSNKLAAMMAERGINLSIISPRKIPALQELFEKASSPEIPFLPHKDYTTDPRHMILLHGFQLEERSHSPSVEDDKQTSEYIKSNLVNNNQGSGVNLRVHSPAAAGLNVDGGFKVPGSAVSSAGSQMNTAASGNQQQPSPQHNQLSPLNIQNQPSPQMNSQAAPPQAQKKDQANVMIPSQRTNIAQMRQQNIATSQQNVQMVTSQPNMVAVSSNNQSINPMNPPNMSQGMNIQSSNASVMTSQPALSLPSNQQGMVMNQAQQQQQQQQQQFGVNTMPGPSSGPQQVFNPGDLTGQQLPGQQPGQGQQIAGNKRVIWKGVLEYQEKPQKISRSLSCYVTLGPTDADVNANNWPVKLLMQLLPQNMLSELTGLFRNSRQVSFNFSPNDMEILRSLYKIMGNGFAGCVHFPSTSQCDVRVILLLFSSKKKAFIGLIPNDQVAFVQGIRTVLSKHKERSQVRQAMMSQTHSVQQSLSTPPQMQQQQQTGGAVGMGHGPPTTMNSTPNMSMIPGQMQNQIPSTITNSLPTTQGSQIGQMSSSTVQQQQHQLLQQQQLNASGQQPIDNSNVALLQQKIQALQQELQGAKQKEMQKAEQAKLAARQQQHLLARQQLQQQQQLQQRQLQLQQQQQQQQQQHPQQVPNQQQLRQLLQTQQHMRQQQQLMMQRGTTPQQQTGLPPDGQQGMQMQQQQPNQNFMSEFNLQDNF